MAYIQNGYSPIIWDVMGPLNQGTLWLLLNLQQLGVNRRLDGICWGIHTLVVIQWEWTMVRTNGPLKYFFGYPIRDNGSCGAFNIGIWGIIILGENCHWAGILGERNGH